MGSVTSLFHPVVAVSDMKEAVAYYRDLLGLDVTFDGYHDPAAISELFGVADPIVHAVVVSCPDGSEIELVEFEQPRGTVVLRRPGDPGLMAVNLLVDGIDDVVMRLAAAGRAPKTGPIVQTLADGAQIKVAVCAGPDEVAILLVGLPPGRTSLAPTS